MIAPSLPPFDHPPPEPSFEAFSYTVHDIHSFLADQIVSRGAAPGGLTLYYARPPVEGLNYEMDVRSIPVQRIV